ncbi:MAG: helix-turn-helix domain-containing protein [Chloroflexi bacterium]|nr:helix-turn-helix domain-containing protein [Chloroflexota bacterium]
MTAEHMPADLPFPDQLRAWRIARDLTQVALAARAQCSSEVIRKFESGTRRPSLLVAEALADALELSGEQRVRFVAAARGVLLHHRSEAIAATTESVSPGAEPVQSVPLAEPTQHAPLTAGLLSTVHFARTKLQMPRRRSAVLIRSRLIERIRRGSAEARVILVSAPAGAGKTTLLGTAMAALDHPYAWVNLDDEDNEPRRLLAVLIAAAEQIAPGSGVEAQRLLDTTVTARIDPSILARRCGDALINGLLERLTSPSLFVLDDLHALTAPACFAVVTELIEQLPANLTLVIATRHDPPVALARLRARRDLVELRLDDLRFTAAEVAALLNDILGQELAPGEILALERRTEGWAAGLSLFAASLERIATPAERERFFSRLNQTDRSLFDYLAEEVLNRQDPFVRMFLLETSILASLTPATCRAVTGRADAVVVLDDLYRRNLFLVQLDDRMQSTGEETSYRYHDLFRDFLRTRLEREAPEHFRAVHRRAAEIAADPNEAIDHLLKAGLWTQAAARIAQVAQTLLEQGAHHTLHSWLEALPNVVIQTSPRLALTASIVKSDSARVAEAETWLNYAEQGAAQLPEGQADYDLWGQIALHSAMLAAYGGDAQRMAAQTERALTLLRPEQTVLRANAYFMQGLIAVGYGNLMVAEERFAYASEISLSAGKSYLAGAAASNQTYIQRARGRPGSALATCERMLAYAGALGSELSKFVGIFKSWQADILRERNRLEEALNLAKAGAYSSLFWGNADGIILTHLVLARVHQARGERQQARDVIAAAQSNTSPIPWMQPILNAFEAQLALAEDAANALTHIPRPGESDLELFRGLSPHGFVYDYEHRRIASSQVALASAYAAGHRPPVALREHLARLRSSAVAVGLPWLEIKALVLDALAAALCEDAEGTDYALRQALELAAPEEYIRVFLDEGPPLIAPLHTFVTRHERHRTLRDSTIIFAKRLLDALIAEGGEKDAPTQAKPTRDLAEPLTPREREVLQLLAQGANTAEIADHLVISPHTAKRHIANILGKLGVHSRTAAAIRARALGIGD